MSLHRIWLLLVAFSLTAVLNAHAGHPEPAQRQTQGRRDANMALLQFQNALAADHWSDALSLCSADVQNIAKQWPNAEKFFKDTMPIEHVLARGDFGCWSCGDKFYGMFETISAYDEQPRIDWYWGIRLAGNGKWVMDYPPVRLAEYVVQRKALIQAHDDKVAALRLALEAKMPFVSTRLVPLTNKFALGQPMCFRVDLTNAGPADVCYMDGGLNHYGLVVRDERGQGTVLTNTAAPAQIGVQTKELPARSAVVLAEVLDITQNHRITGPGKYSVQFDGSTLSVGERVPMELEMDDFGRKLGIGSFAGLFPATNKFPSNVVTIDVRR
jgi:hypothetical protein